MKVRLGQAYELLNLVAVAAVLTCSVAGEAAVYRKATEGREVVKDKIYPKERKFELNAPNLGFIMNQSYVNTFLVSGSANYYFSENWGLGLDISVGVNIDKAERACIESFYYDPEDEVGIACGDASLLEGRDANNNGFPRLGPAYVPIREINNVIMANAIWTPVYGKQLLMLSATSYFDLFVEMGLGVANSTFYAKRDTLANGNVPRDVFNEVADDASDAEKQAAAEANAKIGATIEEDNSYGTNGRPDPAAENHVLINLGVGQKFHFGGMFHFKVYIRNMLLLGTDQGFDNLLSLHGGFGARF